MFGSLRIQRGLLVGDDRRRYRAAFCAGCHALHDLAGRPTALLTNYDQTVLALVLAGLGPVREPVAGACTALPFRSIAVQPLDDRSAALLAALDVGAVRAKLHDDVQDGDRVLLGRVALKLLLRPGETARAALRALGFPVSLLDGLPDAQAAAERLPAPAIEELCGPSAELTGQVFAHAGLAVGRPELAGALRTFGEGLGTWVYAYDAWRDLPDDLRLGRFNAWAATGRTSPGDISEFLRDAVDRAASARRGLSLGAQGPIVDALLASLRHRSRSVHGSARTRPARDRRQAGDCVCPDIGCCEGASCCGDAGAPVAEGSGCSVGGDACCDLTCCWWTSDARERRTIRRVHHATRRGLTVSDVDLTPLVGAEGDAATDLLPQGRVTVRGLTFDAVAETGMIDSGARVVVRAVDGGRLQVARATR